MAELFRRLFPTVRRSSSEPSSCTVITAIEKTSAASLVKRFRSVSRIRYLPVQESICPTNLSPTPLEERINRLAVIFIPNSGKLT
ncbi:hypothetical protein [Neisseria sp.]|uniref:hypothetical protein n=1 Tax=Neisseria sp. TaxID=192066 RepID=UPI0035A1747D